jgi:hypothetical protein
LWGRPRRFDKVDGLHVGGIVASTIGILASLGVRYCSYLRK